ncbi:hypothetical protein ACUOFC_50270, partial [Escherichia sp. TWPC-MK]
MRTVKVFEEAWPLHTPFVIARGSRSEAHVVVVELEEEGITFPITRIRRAFAGAFNAFFFQ